MPRALSALTGLPFAAQVTHGEGTIDLVVTDAVSALPIVIETAAAAGSTIRSAVVEAPNLETVFLHLTGKRLRD